MCRRHQACAIEGAVMRRIVVLLVVIPLVACSSGATTASRAVTAPAPQLLFFATPLGVTVVDAATGRATLTAPDGILAPDRSTVFGTSSDVTATLVQRFEPVSGQAKSVTTLDGAHRLRVANHDG